MSALSIAAQQTIMRGGEAIVIAPNIEEATSLFFDADELVKEHKMPIAETTVKRVIKCEG